MIALLKIYFILTCIILLLNSCGGVKEKIGIIKKAPDEFQVYESKPLSVPPNFELRPPAEGEILANENDESIIFSDENNIDKNLTLSDEILLISLGEKEIEKNIRKIINDENSIQEVDKSLLDKIINFEPIFEGEKNKESEIINAVEEKKRIEDLKSDIKSIETNLEDTENNNETDEEKSFLDNIFDFDLFGQEDEELESTNQRDRTFFSKKKNTSVAGNNEIDIIDEKEKINSSNEEKKIIDAVISEKEGSLD
tara:strand:+ start:1090 stop:1851 length:762 start_codon:yes stop_codon:yes gene_type:complete